MSEEEKPKDVKAEKKESPRKEPDPETVASIQSPDEEIEAAIAKSKIKGQKKVQTKKYIKYGIIGTVVFVLAWFVHWLFKPYEGTMAFGICKVFAELQLQYPSTMRASSVDTFKDSVRVWFTYTDSFGEYRMEPIQCFFRPDEELGSVLDKVTIRRREVDEAIVEEFNKTIPAILKNPPNLILPYQSDSLKGMQIDPYRMMKPIF